MYVNHVQAGDDARVWVNVFSFMKYIFRVKPGLVVATFTFSYHV